MTFLSIHKLSGDANDLLQRKQAHMAPVVSRIAPEFGAILSITAPVSDGIITINLWENAEGSIAFTQHQEVQRARANSGLPMPTTFERYDNVYVDDYSQDT
jgi:hypothetical protein